MRPPEVEGYLCRALKQDFVAGKVVRLRQKLIGAADAVKGFFGAKKNQDSAVEKLEALRVRHFSDE